MKILITCLLSFTLLITCSSLDANSPMFRDLPATESIIPLRVGNTWTFSYTFHDSTISRIFSQYRLTLKIPSMYLLTDTGLILVTDHELENMDSEQSPYVYELQWDNRDSTTLVMHKGDIELEKRGLYIVGKKYIDSVTLYDTARLWLRYPSTGNATWFLGPDTSLSARMELLSIDTSFYIHANSSSPTPVTVVDNCYKYRETLGDYVHYYYYNHKIGPLGSLYYENGTLKISYILIDFYQNPYGMHYDRLIK